MELIITPAGVVHCLYDEAIDLATLGSVHIRRASTVEPDTSGGGAGGWCVDLSPVGGPMLGPFARRSLALEAERAWIQHHPAVLAVERSASAVEIKTTFYRPVKI